MDTFKITARSFAVAALVLFASLTPKQDGHEVAKREAKTLTMTPVSIAYNEDSETVLIEVLLAGTCDHFELAANSLRSALVRDADLAWSVRFPHVDDIKVNAQPVVSKTAHVTLDPTFLKSALAIEGADQNRAIITAQFRLSSHTELATKLEYRMNDAYPYLARLHGVMGADGVTQVVVDSAWIRQFTSR